MTPPSGQNVPLDIDSTRARPQHSQEDQPQQPQAGELSSLSWLEVEQRLAAHGIQRARECVAGARYARMLPVNVVGLLERKPAIPPLALAKHLLHGTALPDARNGARARRPTPEAVRETTIREMRRRGITDWETIEQAVTERVGAMLEQ